MQERRNSSALALELRLSCTNASISWKTMSVFAKLHLLLADIDEYSFANAAMYVITYPCPNPRQTMSVQGPASGPCWQCGSPWEVVLQLCFKHALELVVSDAIVVDIDAIFFWNKSNKNLTFFTIYLSTITAQWRNSSNILFSISRNDYGIQIHVSTRQFSQNEIFKMSAI